MPKENESRESTDFNSVWTALFGIQAQFLALSHTLNSLTQEVNRLKEENRQRDSAIGTISYPHPYHIELKE